MKSGAARRRPTVTPLAGVARADGPKSVAISDRLGLEVHTHRVSDAHLEELTRGAGAV